MHGIREGVELVGESGAVWLPVKPLGQDNVWIAVNKDNHQNIVILKSPAANDPEPWSKFRHEMVMHELLKECPSIRKQVDRISPQNEHNPPVLVLEILATTLWHARTKRPFSKSEVLSVSRGILNGLDEIHSKGLVYADLKMENIMLNGFDTTSPGSGQALTTKLCDLGIVMAPDFGKVQPLAFRAPEVYFKGEITSKADIWAFGLVYCHLLEAQSHFSVPGLYDDLETVNGTIIEKEQAVRYELADNYDIRSVDYYQGCHLPYQHHDREAGEQWERLRERGLTARDIEFLQWVLQVDPTKRPSARAILKSSWFSQSSLQDAPTAPTEVDGTADQPPSRPVLSPRPSSREDVAKDATGAELRKYPFGPHIGRTAAQGNLRETLKREATSSPSGFVARKKSLTSNDRSKYPAVGSNSTPQGTYLSYR